MAEESQDDKTETPTEKRRRDSREEGQVAFSREVSSAAILGGILLLFYFYGNFFLKDIADLMRLPLQNFLLGDFNNALMEQLSLYYLKESLIIIGPFFLFILALGLMGSIAQVGLQFTWKPMQPKFSKISPLKGLQRLFSMQTVNELFKNIFKLTLIGYVGYYTVAEHINALMNMSSYELPEIIDLTTKVIGLFCFRIFLAFLILSSFDYVFQRWDTEKKLKMSKQDVKEEMKQTEGDPQIKAKIRQAQQKMSQARMMQEVPGADAVIVNPTHFAVVVKYDRETMVSPQIVAKGLDHLALRIMQIAQKSNVPIVRNPPVARGLYQIVEIGEEVPAEFYKVMAEILASVYRSRTKNA